MKSFRDRSPYAIGIASVLLIGTFVGIAFMVGVLHLLEHTYRVDAVFADAAGIRKGDSVRVAGVKVGRVTDIVADRRHGTVVVSLVVDKNIELGPRTRAEIALETLLGTKFVRLSGPVQRPYLADMATAKRRIPLERTSTPFDVFELTTLGARRVEATDNEKLNTFIKQLAKATEGNPADIHTLLESVAKVSSAINERDAQLGQLLERFDRLSKLLDDKDQTLVGLIDQSQAVLDLVQRRRADIALGLRGGDRMAGELAHLLSTNKTYLDAILTTLHPTIDVLDRRAQDLNAGLTFLGPGALGLAKATTHGPWQDIYVRAVGPDVLAVISDMANRKPSPSGAQP